MIPSAAASREIFDDTWKALAEICPPLGRLDPVDDACVVVRGGDIFAWGKSDIDDVSSELHGRSDVGPLSDNGYHSINTGKYTLAPMFAVEVADRICGGQEGQCSRSSGKRWDTEA